MLLPVYWRFLIKTFFSIFVVCTLCTFAIGLGVYSGQFASFIAAGATLHQVLVIVACNLFRVFSIIIGLTTMICAFTTTYQLSYSAEIIALRTSGLSISRILAPLYYCIALVTISNLAGANLLSPYLRRIEANVISQNRSINPLILLRKGALPLSNHLHVEMEITEGGTTAKDMLVAFHDPETNGISLLTADKIKYSPDELQGENSSLITHFQKQDDGFDHLLIANQKRFTTHNSIFQPLFTAKSKKREVSIKAMPTRNLFSIKSFAAHKELIERISTSLIPLTFGVAGVSLGLYRPKNNSESRWYLLLGSVIVFLASFLHAQGMKSALPLTGFFFFLPHIVFSLIAVFSLKSYQENPG